MLVTDAGDKFEMLIIELRCCWQILGIEQAINTMKKHKQMICNQYLKSVIISNLKHSVVTNITVATTEPLREAIWEPKGYQINSGPSEKMTATMIYFQKFFM